MLRPSWQRHLLASLFVIAVVASPRISFSQTMPPNTVGGGFGSGVIIDADGVLSRQVFDDPTGELHRKRFEEARRALAKDIATPSKLRKVSLTRLEAAIAKKIEDGERPSDAMKYLAGLTRIRYVFYYPETKEIVIAGPAEGWGTDLAGRVVGLNSGRPVLELEDLIVALRAFPPKGDKPAQVYCSIDPTEEGLAKMQKFLKSVGSSFSGPPNRDIEQRITTGLRDSLGLQKITVGGIPATTHFAEVMVEADYRMKLIGIGLEVPPVKLASYVSLASASAISKNAMQRWFFVPEYECVRVSDDQLAMQLVGDGVKLVGEDEVVQADGSRVASGGQSRASQMFTKNFTTVYPQLAAKSPVYAQLRNCIDMLVASAFMQKSGFYTKAGWDLGVLGDEEVVSVENRHAPERVASAVNALWKGSRLLTPIGGGVVIDPVKALDSPNLLSDDDGKLGAERAAINLGEVEADRWWWD